MDKSLTNKNRYINYSLLFFVEGDGVHLVNSTYIKCNLIANDSCIDLRKSGRNAVDFLSLLPQ